MGKEHGCVKEKAGGHSVSVRHYSAKGFWDTRDLWWSDRNLHGSCPPGKQNHHSQVKWSPPCHYYYEYTILCQRPTDSNAPFYLQKKNSSTSRRECCTQETKCLQCVALFLVSGILFIVARVNTAIYFIILLAFFK